MHKQMHRLYLNPGVHPVHPARGYTKSAASHAWSASCCGKFTYYYSHSAQKCKQRKPIFKVHHCVPEQHVTTALHSCRSQCGMLGQRALPRV